VNLAEAWELLLRDLPEGVPIRVLAAEIKARTGLEPRLMAKFDHRQQLPEALRRRNLFLLPVRNGEYVLLPGEGYHTLEPCPAPDDFPSRAEFTLRTLEQGLSESQYLDLAYHSGVLSHFSGVATLFPTIRGRKRAPRFRLRVGGADLEVEGVQVEVDAGYEGPGEVLILEAKIGDPPDFHLRQLYYPFRFWSQLTPKRVRPIFFTFSPQDGVIRLREYEFDPPDVYRVPRLVRAAAYRLRPRRGRLPVWRCTPSQVLSVPQADDLEKVARLPFLVSQGLDRPGRVAEELGFSARQGGYYTEACQMLGLLGVDRGLLHLTEAGRDYVEMEVEPRHEFLARLVLELPIMRRALVELLLSPSRRLEHPALVDLVARESGLSGSTASRRAQTLRRWFAWLGQALGPVRVGRGSIELVAPARVEELRLF
jgi:hypothetical protein